MFKLESIGNVISKIPHWVIKFSLIVLVWFIVKFILNKVLNKYIKAKKQEIEDITERENDDTQSQEDSESLKRYKDTLTRKVTNSVYFRHAMLAAATVIAILESMTIFQSTSKLLSVIVASSGLLAIVVGMAAQESLSDIINGFSIIIFRPFEVGDRITLVSKDLTGTIHSITLRHTILKTYSNSYVTIPNSVMAKEIIENFNLKDNETRSFIDVDVAYDVDIEEAIRVIQDCVFSHNLIINASSPTDVFVQVRNFGSSGIALRVNVWTATIEDNFKACSELRIAIKKEFDRHGIEIPYQKVEFINGGTKPEQ